MRTRRVPAGRQGGMLVHAWGEEGLSEGVFVIVSGAEGLSHGYTCIHSPPNIYIVFYKV